MSRKTFSNTRQQASAAALAAALTLGTLFSLHLLATPAAADLSMAASAASNAKVVSHGTRAPQV